MSTLSAEELIDLLHLAPLDGEGGYFRQTHIVPGDGESGPITTAILFLVTPNSWSGLHRLAEDEMFHFYLGDPCRMVTFDGKGVIRETILGHDIAGGQQVQVNVPGGCWQGTMLHGSGELGYALVDTTMTPGFRVDQFELATEVELATMPTDAEEALRPFLSSHQSPVV